VQLLKAQKILSVTRMEEFMATVEIETIRPGIVQVTMNRPERPTSNIERRTVVSLAASGIFDRRLIEYKKGFWLFSHTASL